MCHVKKSSIQKRTVNVPFRSLQLLLPSGGAMDPLTHTLVGANLAATRLGQTTRLAAPALIVGANLPDVDAIFYFTGQSDFALGFRRGWTHGILALFVLPLVLTGLLMLYDRMRPDPERPVRAAWLLGLSALGILTHPALDWLNNYGMRWLMPFRGTWSYGDSVYIMDPWLWLVLGAGWLAGRRPNLTLAAIWLVITLLILRIVFRRSPEYLPLVIVIALLLLGALLWRLPQSFSSSRVASVAVILACAYIGTRLLIHGMTVGRVDRELARLEVTSVEAIMAAPHPIDPTRWDVVARTATDYRSGLYSWRDGVLTLDAHRITRPVESPEWSAARGHPSIRGFMTWVRFPWYEVERTATETRVIVGDARYARRRTRGFGGAVVVLPSSPHIK